MSEVGTNLLSAFEPGYSQTSRLGELLEEKIFSRVQDGGGTQERVLPDLLINPCGGTIGLRAETGQLAASSQSSHPDYQRHYAQYGA